MKILKKLTVFTPTYNRAHTLVRTYESLCRQTCDDFEWLVIDDGSTDNTEETVKGWITENKISIRYIKKENGGLGSGYSVALQNIDTELNVCIDSDDFMPDDAVEIIIKTWKEKGNENLAGIIGLDFPINSDEPIGGYFKDISKPYHFLDIGHKLHHYGDTKMVLRTELLKPFLPMKSFPGEKNFNPIYLFYLIDPNLDYILINKNLCYVDYQATGMGAGLFKQFMNSPRSFAEIRKVKLTHPKETFKRKFKDAAHITTCAMIAKDKSIFTSSPKKPLVLAASPMGVALYFYFKYKTSK